MYFFLQFASGDYFCRVSNAKTFDTKKGNIDNCPKEYCDSSSCNVKVVLPTKEQISNGYLEFSNEDIRILEQPDVSNTSETKNEGKPMSSLATSTGEFPTAMIMRLSINGCVVDHHVECGWDGR